MTIDVKQIGAKVEQEKAILDCVRGAKHIPMNPLELLPLRATISPEV